jgi:hypothetical protein
MADELLTPPRKKNEGCKAYSSLSARGADSIRWDGGQVLRELNKTLRVTHHMHCRLHTERSVFESLTSQTLDKYAISCSIDTKLGA